MKNSSTSLHPYLIERCEQTNVRQVALQLMIAILAYTSLTSAVEAQQAPLRRSKKPISIFLDSDKDGVPDSREWQVGTDPNSNIDTDGDGVPDDREIHDGTDPRGFADTDLDGLADEKEAILKTDPNTPDTDGDGLLDGPEVWIHHSNPLTPDTDSDGLSDLIEVLVGLNPTSDDTDNDGLPDGAEKTTDPTRADTDGDGLLDGEEISKYGTSPNNWDSDGGVLPTQGLRGVSTLRKT